MFYFITFLDADLTIVPRFFRHQGALVLLCMWGIGVCIYALSVEFHKEADPGYEAMCDISETMSCSKVLTSEWGKGFGLLGTWWLFDAASVCQLDCRCERRN